MLEAEESSRIPSKPTEKRRKQKRKKRKRKNHRRPEMSGDGRTAGPSSSSRSPLDLFLFRPRVAFFLAFFLEIFFHLGQIFRPFFFLFSRPAAALSAPNAILVGYRVFFFKQFFLVFFFTDFHGELVLVTEKKKSPVFDHRFRENSASSKKGFISFIFFKGYL